MYQDSLKSSKAAFQRLGKQRKLYIMKMFSAFVKGSSSFKFFKIFEKNFGIVH